MKKNYLAVFVVVVVAALMLVNCVKPITIAAPTFGAGAVEEGSGFVLLSWEPVVGATAYSLRIVPAAGGSQRGFPVTVFDPEYEFDPTEHGMGYGAYNWFVKALKDGKESEERQGPNFTVNAPVYGPPEVTTGEPVAGTIVNPADPLVFNFTATPGGELPASNARGANLDSLTLKIGTTEGAADILEQNVLGLETFTLAADTLGWGDTYYWTVVAVQGDNTVPADPVEISTCPELEMWISEDPIVGSERVDPPTYHIGGDIIYGKVIANNDEITEVQIWIEEVLLEGEPEPQPLDDMQALVDGELYFEIPRPLAGSARVDYFDPNRTVGDFVAIAKGENEAEFEAESEPQPFKIVDDNAYAAPDVEAIGPAEGASFLGDVAEITFTFAATPGEAGAAMDTRIVQDLVSLTLFVGGVADWDLLEVDVLDAGGEYVWVPEAGDLDWAGQYRWKIVAEQTDGQQNEVIRGFNTRPQMELELSQVPFEASGRVSEDPTYSIGGDPIFGKLIVWNREQINEIQVWIEEILPGGFGPGLALDVAKELAEGVSELTFQIPIAVAGSARADFFDPNDHPGEFSAYAKGNNDYYSNRYAFAIVDENTYADPRVDTYTPDGTERLMPNDDITFTFDATPGAAEAGARIAKLESLTLKVGTADGVWDLLVEPLTVLEEEYTWENPGLVWETTYYWTVEAVQNDGNVEQRVSAPTKQFETYPQVELEISSTPFEEEGSARAEEDLVFWLWGQPLYGKVTAYNELLDSVDIYLEQEGSNDLLRVLLRALVEEGKYKTTTFQIPYDFYAERAYTQGSRPSYEGILLKGFWRIWAQGLGDLAKSDKVEFEVKEPEGNVTLSATFETPPLEEDIELPSGSKICGPWEYPCGIAGGATVTYDITVDFNMLFADWGVTLERSETVEDNSWSRTIPATGFVWDEETKKFATEVVVFYATECTKFATVTLWGTDTLVGTDMSSSPHAYDPWHDELATAAHWFIYDTEDPTAVIDFDPDEFVDGMATITFFASDTKCLEDIEFNFFVEKGDEWPLDVDWETVSFLLGEGKTHEITGSATYAKTTDEAYATFTLNLSEWGMDGATITVNATVDDCCDFGIGHVVNVATETYVDSVFFSNDTMNATWATDYGWNGDNLEFTNIFKDDDGLWLPVPAFGGENATLTFYLWDKEIDDATVTWAFNDSATGAVSITEGATRAFVCTGFNVKDEWTLDFTDLYGTPTELIEATSSTLTIDATDGAGNTFQYTLTLNIDLLPASLTYVNGHKGNSATGEDDFVVFGFDQDVNIDFDDFAATLTVLNKDDQEQRIQVYNKDDFEQLVMTDKSSFKITTKNFPLPSDGTVRLEVYAQDEHGNKYLSTLAGPISESASNR